MGTDTIAAIATPLSSSGIGIIRISGPEAIDIASEVFRPKREKDIKKAATYTAHYGHAVKDGKDIDECILLIMKGPHSYTAEDVAEIELPTYRDSIYRERAVVGERIRLAMGMSLRPADKPARITKGIKQSNIAEKYYEPPLLQVIPAACNACKDRAFIVGGECQGCMAHPCMEVCPKNAISFVDGYSYIDQEKCIKCGQCQKVCPYSAIHERKRPCEVACGVGAIDRHYCG